MSSSPSPSSFFIPSILGNSFRSVSGSSGGGGGSKHNSHQNHQIVTTENNINNLLSPTPSSSNKTTSSITPMQQLSSNSLSSASVIPNANINLHQEISETLSNNNHHSSSTASLELIERIFTDYNEIRNTLKEQKINSNEFIEKFKNINEHIHCCVQTMKKIICQQNELNIKITNACENINKFNFCRQQVFTDSFIQRNHHDQQQHNESNNNTNTATEHLHLDQEHEDQLDLHQHENYDDELKQFHQTQPQTISTSQQHQQIQIGQQNQQQLLQHECIDYSKFRRYHLAIK